MCNLRGTDCIIFIQIAQYYTDYSFCTTGSHKRFWYRYHSIKNARIQVFTDPYSLVKGQNPRFCLYTGNADQWKPFFSHFLCSIWSTRKIAISFYRVVTCNVPIANLHLHWKSVFSIRPVHREIWISFLRFYFGGIRNTDVRGIQKYKTSEASYCENIISRL